MKEMKRKKLSYGRTKAVKKCKEHLYSLIECRDDTYDQLARIQAEHLALGICSTEEAEEYFTSYPIESLNESCGFDNKKNIRFRLKELDRRGKLRKQWDAKEDQLDKIDDAIYIAEIDITIEKIKDLLRRADKQ